jgi:acetyl esterase/lipase
MKLRFNILCFLSLALLFSSCAFKSINRYKNITYRKPDISRDIDEEQLNIFSPHHHKSREKDKSLKNVFVFIHGGGWKSGKKSLYGFFGSRMARKDVVMVIIDYPLAPKAKYKEMATSSALAVQWVKNNIQNYGGDPERIFVAGHSAGGHLAALITVSNKYFDSLQTVNPIRGTILIDAAGLDMCSFLKDVAAEPENYRSTFTSDSLCWKDASPLYQLSERLAPVPPMLIYAGEKTYPTILRSNEKFVETLKASAPEPTYVILKGKKHIPMITQFFDPWNPRYDEIIQFMNNSNGKNLEAKNIALGK